MANNEASVSRAALLALKRERELIEQGHRFLDEKRVLLAREQLRRLDLWQQQVADLQQSERDAQASLMNAVTDYGLLDLEAHPPALLEIETTRDDRNSFLGLDLPDRAGQAILRDSDKTPTAARPGVEDVKQRYARIVECAIEATANLTAMLRLDAEYRRTERSVRALENVVMPEVDEQQRAIEDALQELDQEEAVRVRLFADRRDRDPAG